MALVLPAAVLAAVWLWRGRSLGYALAGVMLALLSLPTLAIAAMMVSMRLDGQPVAPGSAAVFGTVSAAALGMLAWDLKGSGQPPASRSRS